MWNETYSFIFFNKVSSQMAKPPQKTCASPSLNEKWSKIKSSTSNCHGIRKQMFFAILNVAFTDIFMKVITQK